MPRSAASQMLDTVISSATSWVALTLAIAVAPGLAMWPLANVDELGYVVTNQLDVDLRFNVLGAMGFSAAVVLTFYGVVFAWLRSTGSALSVRQVCRGLNRYTFVALAFPLLTAAMSRGIEVSNPIFTLALIGLVTGFFAFFVYRLQELAAPRKTPRPSTPGATHWGFVVASFAFYAGYMSYLALLDHRNIGTHIYDLGIYDNIFWNTAFDDFLGCSYCKLENHVSAHFDPIIWVWSWVYRLRPNAETILVIQAVWLATTVFPLFLLAQRKLENPRLAALFCWIAVLYPPLHGVNMFDFHSLTMVVPTVVWIIYFIDSGARAKLWIALAIMLATREDMPLLACFLGAYAMLRRRHFTGLAMVCVSLSYLVIVKFFIMPDPGLLMSSKDTHGYAYFFKEMIPHQSEGIKGFVISLLTNPAYALQVLFQEKRVFFFLVLLQSLLFMPLLGGKKRFIMIYGLLFLGLATRTYVYNLHFQYSSVLFPVLLAATPHGVVAFSRGRVPDILGIDRRRVPTTLMWTMFVSMLCISVKYGAMVPNDHFKAGWNRLSRKLDTDRYEYLQTLLDRIPEDAVVCATSSLGPHVSARDKGRKWPSCKEAEYALLMTGRFKKKDVRRLERAVKQKRLVLIDEDHDIALYEHYQIKPTSTPRSRGRTVPPGSLKPKKGKIKIGEPPENPNEADGETGGEEEDDDPRNRPPEDLDIDEMTDDERDPSEIQ